MAIRKSEFFPSLLASSVELCGGMECFDRTMKLTANNQKDELNFVHKTSDQQLNALQHLPLSSEPVKVPDVRLTHIQIERRGSDMKAGELAS
jgi:hypothetical protein